MDLLAHIIPSSLFKQVNQQFRGTDVDKSRRFRPVNMKCGKKDKT
jgi:hypothetical protein